MAQTPLPPLPFPMPCPPLLTNLNHFNGEAAAVAQNLTNSLCGDGASRLKLSRSLSPCKSQMP